MNTENSNQIEIILEDASKPIIELESLNPVKDFESSEVATSNDDYYVDYDVKKSTASQEGFNDFLLNETLFGTIY